jgi:flagellar protein FliS
VAERLYQTYNALILACLRSYGRPRARDNYRRIIASLAELRDAWKHVDATVAKAGSTRVADSVGLR